MLAVIGWCVWSLVVESRELRELRAEQSHLETLVGRLEVTDPSQIAVRCIQHSAPVDFSWRIYVPAGVGLATGYSMAAGGGGFSSGAAATEPFQQLVRLRLLEEQGRYTLFLLHASGSAVSSLPDMLVQFIQRHANELTITVAGRDEQLTVSRNQVITLLEIEVPESLMPQAKDELKPYLFKQLKQGPLLRVEIGPQQAFQTRDAARSQAREAGQSE